MLIDLAAFWPRLGLDVVLGSVSGGVTSWVAVVLIFRPYERTFGLHGAIPKNKARLAKTIGRTVGERLLTPEDIAAELQRSGLREAIEARIVDLVIAAMEVERGSIRDLLPAAMVAELERALAEAAPGAAEGYARLVESADFEQQVRAFVARAREEVAPVPMSAVLTPERRTGLASQAADFATELIAEGRAEKDRTARAKLGDLLLRLAGTERTRSFVERTVHEALERAESRRIGELLEPLDDTVITGWVLEAARSDRARALAAEAVTGAGTALLDRPLGRLSRWIPADVSRRLSAAVAPAVWDQIVTRMPAFLETVDIPGMVERKVLGFSTQRVEEIVRGVTQRELNLIVQLGYALGALIGAAQFGFERWLGR